MAKRKYLSKKIRFEVFKRDNFTCQYCGREAPDIVLNVDHIKSVKDGGSNDMLNLITSCFDCNNGKRAISLSDDTCVKKQKAQMKLLNAKNEQLDLIIKWRSELQEIGTKEVDYIESILKDKTGYSFSNTGKSSLKKAIKKYNFKAVADSVDTAIDQYVKFDKEDNACRDSVNKALDYYPRILSSEKKFKDKPHMKDLYYIRGILRNRLHYVNEWKSLELLESAYNKGAKIQDLKDISLKCRNWTDFQEGMSTIYEVYA